MSSRYIRSEVEENSLTWLELSVDQAGQALRVEQAIAQLATVKTLLFLGIAGFKRRNFW